MTRATSHQAYELLVASGLLVKKQADIVRKLVVGDATSGEVIAALQAERPDDRSLRNVNAWRARFTELQQRGLIVEAGERECGVTGRRALVWRFTGRTKPLKVVRVARGAKAWKALALGMWADLKSHGSAGLVLSTYKNRIRALGGKP